MPPLLYFETVDKFTRVDEKFETMKRADVREVVDVDVMNGATKLEELMLMTECPTGLKLPNLRKLAIVHGWTANAILNILTYLPNLKTLELTGDPDLIDDVPNLLAFRDIQKLDALLLIGSKFDLVRVVEEWRREKKPKVLRLSSQNSIECHHQGDESTTEWSTTAEAKGNNVFQDFVFSEFISETRRSLLPQQKLCPVAYEAFQYLLVGQPIQPGGGTMLLKDCLESLPDQQVIYATTEKTANLALTNPERWDVKQTNWNDDIVVYSSRPRSAPDWPSDWPSLTNSVAKMLQELLQECTPACPPPSPVAIAVLDPHRTPPEPAFFGRALANQHRTRHRRWLVEMNENRSKVPLYHIELCSSVWNEGFQGDLQFIPNDEVDEDEEVSFSKVTGRQVFPH